MVSSSATCKAQSLLAVGSDGWDTAVVSHSLSRAPPFPLYRNNLHQNIAHCQSKLANIKLATCHCA